MSREARSQQEMVQQQLVDRGIRDERVLQAMQQVPREAFVREEFQPMAFHDRPLPAGHRQTISQPYTVAFMCEALKLKPDDVVLEVGTGSGYGAAVLGCLAARVETVERIPELAEEARNRLQRLGSRNITVHLGDGSLGWPAGAPYDAICVTAAGAELPPTFAEQLAEGGRILIPLGQASGPQQMMRFTKQGNRLQRESLGAFAFVPLIGEFGQRQPD